MRRTPRALRGPGALKQWKTLLVPLLLAFVLLGTAYSFMVPIYEAPDEPEHVARINYIYLNRSLGNPTVGWVPLQIEPPLYHATLALLLYLIGSGPISLHLVRSGTHFPAYFTHSEAEQNFSLPEVRVFHVLRLLSVIFSMGTIVTTYKTARFLFKDGNLPLLTAAMAAFIPQFTFMSSVVNYDALANFLSAVSFFFVFKLLASVEFVKRDVKLTGLSNGVALLAKISNFLVPLITLAGFILKFGLSNWSDRWKLVRNYVIVVAITLAVSGWFFVRNQLIYGNPVGWTLNPVFINPNAGFTAEPKTLFSSYFTSGFFFNQFFNSFWLNFGWMNVQGPMALYWVLRLFTLIAVVGVCCSAASAYRKNALKLQLLGICTLFVLLTFAMIVYFNLWYTQYQGRYMFPAISAISLLTVEGLSWVSERATKMRAILPAILGGFLFLVNVAALLSLPGIYS